MSARAGALFLVVLPMVWAQRPVLTLQATVEATGEVSLHAFSATGASLAKFFPEIIHCQGGITSSDVFDDFHCKNALRRQGLSLEADFDLSPIARTLAPSDEIRIWLHYPRLGFDASSMAIKDEGTAWQVVQRLTLSAGAISAPIRIQFGYRRDQLAGIYLPFALLALAFAFVAMGLSRAGHADLNRSLFLLGTIFWLGAAMKLHAADPLRILFSGTPFANIAATLLGYFPPLLCIAAGAAFGDQNTERPRREIFAELFWGLGIFVFPLAGALGGVQSMVGGSWLDAAPWLIFAPTSVFLCRWRLRASAAVTVRQLGAGELLDRVSALAARAGRRDIRVFISSSARSQVMNAFALLRKGILMTAPLVRTLTRREVDAVVAHELSHFGHVRRSPWAALAIAAVFFQMPLAEVLLQGTVGLVIGVLFPATVYLAALHGLRKREFAADAGSVALTGDARAMISALARIARHNKKPIDCNSLVEWFSTHPSTGKRLRALASAARLAPEELETLRTTDAAGEPYPVPTADSSAVFSLAWQNTNASRYVWTTLLGASAAGLFVAGLLDKFALSSYPALLGGIVLGCAITKALSSTVMSVNYALLRRKLGVKIGGAGQLVGLAIDSEPRVYHGFRFSDAGFLSFHDGMLCYRSERISIRLNPADVVEVSMIAAAPSSWRRLAPMIRFRRESGDVSAFILHPVAWLATPRRLFRSIERWKAASASNENTSTSGLDPIAGQLFQPPTISRTARGFRIPAIATLAGTTLAGWFVRGEFWPAWYALAITACAYTFMYLPAMLYRPSSIPPPLPRPADAD